MKLFRKLKPKSFLYWFLGDRAGNTLVATWNWLWGIPIESGGKIAVEAARESLASMEQAIAELVKSVAKIDAAHKSALAKTGEKENEHTELLRQVAIAHQKGNQEMARLAMAKAIAVEKILPAMQERVQRVQKVLEAAKAKLREEQNNLEIYKLEMSNIQAMGSINEALSSINDFNSGLDLGDAIGTFDDSKVAITGRYHVENARMELSENPIEKAGRELDELTLDEEINRRLAQFNTQN
jgi:phage shock protein A